MDGENSIEVNLPCIPSDAEATLTVNGQRLPSFIAFSVEYHCERPTVVTIKMHASVTGKVDSLAAQRLLSPIR